MTDLFPPIRDRAIAYIRTYTPILIGSILAYLLAHFTIAATVLAQAQVVFGPSVKDILAAAATAAVIALYYWGARQLGKRWPKAEKWLLGSSAVPTYTAQHTA
ncbi:hypothetical protein E3T37_03680 [Cryobacterium sp. TMT2-10]|uniref:hypothetical protein n=1 Tax=Cryobacterium sp. TMT2-10 TaxID=1259244 RepID=UPI00106AC186|nr:hypothetical protein [Cryobacterium sp. TMT2-10]TFD41765.1 hypothetical protein E3T37_03680 [Cryobacterium sp. TMT2-10]